MAEVFRNDPGYAVDLLNSILADPEGEQGELLIVLRQMAKAIGGVRTVAEKSRLNPTQMYRTLSSNGNPELRSMIGLLRAMGMRLAVGPIDAKKPKSARPAKPAKSAKAARPGKVKAA